MALIPRPPVITIMGHVDHGKTTLLDYIRQTKVQAGEAGGITQHIGAYQIEVGAKKLTFIDTPGHAAFTKMRERGAKITDIVVLVVAANDGVKPQTIESIRHIKQAKVTTIVAINKIDLADVHLDVVKGQLAEQGIVVQEFGGDVECVELSAKTGKGVDALLETLAVTAELMELKADPDAPLQAVVIESTRDPHRGAIASVIVQQGTLRLRQDIENTEVSGRIKSLVDELGKELKTVGPGGPAEIVGLKDVPAVGSIIVETGNRPIPTSDDIAVIDAVDQKVSGASVDYFLDEKPRLKLIVKADVEGTLEAILQNIDEESVDLIDSGVGDVTENDVEYARTTGALILAFHIRVSRKLKETAKTLGVKIKEYEIIYQLIEDLQKQMLKLIEPTIDEVVTGEAEIIQIFEMKGSKIAGCRVKTGEIKRTDKLHLKRNDEIIKDPTIAGMMHGKEEIQSAKAKNEFGMTFKNKKLDFQVGDILVAYHVEDE